MAHSATGDNSTAVKAIWKTFWILLCITIVEVGLAFAYLEIFEGTPNGPHLKHWLNAVFILLTIAKAYFIVAEFMHLGHEVKNLIMTVLFPLVLFVWFIIAFLADGNSWKNMRKDLAPGTPAPVEAPAPKPAHH